MMAIKPDLALRLESKRDFNGFSHIFYVQRLNYTIWPSQRVETGRKFLRSEYNPWLGKIVWKQ